LYAHTGGDVGDSNNWRAGLSYLSTRAENRAFTQPDIFGRDAELSFTGPSRLAVADFVWKYAPHGNTLANTLKVQGEYFRRHESGDLTYNPDTALESSAGYSARQWGWYLQGVYQFMPTWRAGLRYDRLSAGGLDYGANGAVLASTGFAPRRYTAMVDWTPSEFSRIRLQYARSETVPGITDHEWFLQYILSIGAHGAHKY
jgi:outer membrane receptor protein involved in Fe transport